MCRKITDKYYMNIKNLYDLPLTAKTERLEESARAIKHLTITAK